MATYTILYLHWKKSQKDFDKQLSRLQEQIITAAVHESRVTIKKIRAILNLYILFIKEPGWEQQLKRTEILFNILGRQRDVEICRSLTTSFEKETNASCKEWRQYLQTLLKITGAWANQEIHDYHKKELAKIALALKQDNKLPVGEDFFSALTTIIHTRLSAAKKHLRKPHQVRRNLKEVYYWISLFPANYAGKTWQPDALHNLLDDLGNWQDNEILLQRIKHFRKDYLPKAFEEYKRLIAFQDKINDNKRLLLKTANSKVRRWMKMVMLPEK